jgi:hypothetical protein
VTGEQAAAVIVALNKIGGLLITIALLLVCRWLADWIIKGK